MRRPIFFLFIPILMLAGYQWATHMLYGRGLFLEAMTYAPVRRGLDGSGAFPKSLVGPSFAGGCFSTLAFNSPWIWPKRVWGTGLILMVSCILLLPFMGTLGRFPLHGDQGVRWGLVIQLVLFVSSGVSLMLLAFGDLWKFRDSASLLLFLSIMGTFAFASHGLRLKQVVH